MRSESSPRRGSMVFGRGMILALVAAAVLAALGGAAATVLTGDCQGVSCPGSDAVRPSTIAAIVLLGAVAAIALGVLVYLVGWGIGRRGEEEPDAEPAAPASSSARSTSPGPRSSPTGRGRSGPPDLDEMMEELQWASTDGQDGEAP